jgi:hypothetical protein
MSKKFHYVNNTNRVSAKYLKRKFKKNPPNLKILNKKIADLEIEIAAQRKIKDDASEKILDDAILVNEKKKILISKKLSKSDVGNGSKEENDKLLCVLRGDATSNQFYFLTLLEQFIANNPEWKGKNVNFFWETFSLENQKKILVISRQMSGLCYMHAPVVLQHYMLSIYNLNNGIDLDFTMIDIAKYSRESWSNRELESFLHGNNFIGGDSKHFIEKITQNHNILGKQYCLRNEYMFDKPNFLPTYV